MRVSQKNMFLFVTSHPSHVLISFDFPYITDKLIAMFLFKFSYRMVTTWVKFVNP